MMISRSSPSHGGVSTLMALPWTVSFPNDYTMVMEWGEPHYIATFIVAQGFWEWLPMERPKHFLSPHDPAYNSAATLEELEEYVYGGDWLANVEGYPCLHAWCPVTVVPGERTSLGPQPLLLESGCRRQSAAVHRRS